MRIARQRSIAYFGRGVYPKMDESRLRKRKERKKERRKERKTQIVLEEQLWYGEIFQSSNKLLSINLTTS